MDVNWERWINASIAKAVKTACDTASLFLYVEGAPRNTDTLQDWVELRVNGPDWHGATKSEWVAHVEINILVLSKANQVDNFRLVRNTGLMRSVLSMPIPVFKLGNAIDDDQSFITCLILNNKGGGSLRVNQLGQITGTTLNRNTVDGMFTGNFYG